MDQDTIENFVKNLGKRDFDAVARLILTEFFGFKAIDVDGAGDAGVDMLSFADQMSNKVWASTATQKTVQYREWKKINIIASISVIKAKRNLVQFLPALRLNFNVFV
jgi:predicted transcriptional regulator